MTRNLLAIALLLALPAAASASELSYSYFEAGYVRANPDDGSAASGFGLHGSGTFDERLHIVAGYERVDEDGANADNWRLGLGYNRAFNERVDFVGRLIYDSFSADRRVIGTVMAPSQVELQGNGFSAEAGVRAAFNPHFEVGALLRHSRRDFSDSAAGDDDTDNVTSLVLNGQYKFDAAWGINAELSWDKDGSTIFVGPRFSY